MSTLPHLTILDDDSLPPFDQLVYKTFSEDICGSGLVPITVYLGHATNPDKSPAEQHKMMAKVWVIIQMYWNDAMPGASDTLIFSKDLSTKIRTLCEAGHTAELVNICEDAVKDRDFKKCLLIGTFLFAMSLFSANCGRS